VNPEPIPSATREVAEKWYSNPSQCNKDPVYNLFAQLHPQFNRLKTRGKGILRESALDLGYETIDKHGKIILDSVVNAAANLKEASYLPIQVR
jgi:hypothetical protein